MRSCSSWIPSVLVAASLTGCPDHAAGPVEPMRMARDADRIVGENARAGDPSWELDNPARSHEVEGYGSRITIAPGEGLDVAVNVDVPRAVRWSVYRIGWYGGAGARRVGDGGPVLVQPQPACGRDPITARVECAWKPAFHVDTDEKAVAGVYLVKLVADQLDGYVPFVVRDGRVADVILDVNVTSWQAYNNFGGESLYEDATGLMPHGKAWEVSFDRPFAEDHGAGRFLNWELHMVRFVEALGYDVTYTTTLDTSRDPAHIATARLFLSVANDEYWTVAARDAVEAAKARGTNLAFLGADQALWRIRLQPSSGGAPERVIACYKADQDRDPVRALAGDSAATSLFRDEPQPRPENGLLGVMYNAWLLVPQPLVVTAPSSWVFAGTGLRAGDTLPLMVVFETDTRYDNGAEPPGLEVLASSPFVDAEGAPQRTFMVYHRAPSGAEVLASGTMGWASGLGAPPFSDPRVARVNRNILDRFVGPDGRRGGPDPAKAPWLTAARREMIIGAWASSVTTIAGGDGGDGTPADGPGRSARFRGPAGVAVGADGTVYVSDAPAHQIRRIAADADHTVTTYAGDGLDGVTDGPGAQARFRWPVGLALATDGTLYVADADNHSLRAIAPDSAHTVTTFAGKPSRGGDFADGPADVARFDRPIAVAVEPSGAVLVADMHNCRIRRVLDGTVSTVAGGALGFQDGPGELAAFNNPSGVAVAADGTIFVLDTYNQALRRVAPDGARAVTTLVGNDGVPGLVDGDGLTARLGVQGGLTLARGRLYLADVASARVRVITPGGSAATTTVATFAGDGRVTLADGAGDQAAFAAPLALGAAPDGSLWLADSGNRAIRRLAP